MSSKGDIQLSKWLQAVENMHLPDIPNSIKYSEDKHVRPEFSPSDSERRSLELQIDAQNINESSRSTPSLNDLTKLSSPFQISHPWFEKSRTTGQEMKTNDVFEGDHLGKPPSNQMDCFTNSVEKSTEGIYMCHICSYAGRNHDVFKEHLRTHYPYHCKLCDYTSRTEGRLRHHIEAYHSETQPKNYSGKASKCPTEKIRNYSCRFCKMKVDSKDELWGHLKQHMKPGRIMQCEFCPFATEYTHHFDYHMKNHMRIKPYRCKKCNYECVNKSMLKSHEKTHSVIYQYRCSECKFAAKYLHALKEHIRKRKHGRPIILKADGSLPDNLDSVTINAPQESQEMQQLSSSTSGIPFSPLKFSPPIPPLSESRMNLMENMIRSSCELMKLFSPQLPLSSISTTTSLGNPFLPGILFQQPQLVLPSGNNAFSYNNFFLPGPPPLGNPFANGPVFPSAVPNTPSTSSRSSLTSGPAPAIPSEYPRTQSNEMPIDLSVSKETTPKTQENSSAKREEFVHDVDSTQSSGGFPSSRLDGKEFNPSH